MPSMTRVFVVLPFYGGSLPVGRYCVSALRENGCLVDVFEAPEFFSAFSALQHLKVAPEQLDFLENSFLNVVGEAIIAQVRRFRPDLVLCLAQAPMSRAALKRLRQDNIPTAMWFVEDYRLFGYWRAFAPYYDIFAVIQKEPFFSELEAIGVKNTLYLPMAALPEVHKTMELNTVDKQRFSADLSFMGAGYPNRRNAFRQLDRYNFKIWGTDWDGEPALDKNLQMKGIRISPEDCVRIFNAAKINLNLHSSVNPAEAVSQGDFVNPRTFEIAACGAFQLVDRRGLMSELFADDELATFGSMQELKEKIDYYLERPEEREKIAAKGQARVLREHTYAARMSSLLNYTQAIIPDWPRPKVNASWPEGMSQELITQLDELLVKLDLPPDVDFDTLITALRQQSGRLESLESALLFLDEWKKQYSR